MKSTDIAYIAGIVDGEGYVGIKRSKPYRSQGRTTPGYHARIQIRMVDEPAIAFLASSLGGSYYKEDAKVKRGRPLFCYQASDAKAAEILRTLLPYLRVKKRQAKKVLELRRLQSRGAKHRTKITGYRDFLNSHGTVRRVANRSFSDEYVARCDALWMDCRKMNGLARFN